MSATCRCDHDRLHGICRAHGEARRIREGGQVVTCDCPRPIEAWREAATPILRVVGAVMEERQRQDEKWGEQNHPDCAAHLVGKPLDILVVHGLMTAGSAKQMTDARAKWGRLSWADIAVEELAEAVEAAALGDEDAVRAEVIQLAAVCVQWAQAIDRRQATR